MFFFKLSIRHDCFLNCFKNPHRNFIGYMCILFSFEDKAPLSKGLLIIPSIFSLLLALLFQHYQKFFIYNLQAVKEEFQVSSN